MAIVEKTFQQEPTQSSWADEAVDTVEAVLANDFFLQTVLQSLECRARTCRLELTDDEAGEVTKSLPLVLHQLAEKLPRVLANQVQYNDGSKGIILYLSSAEHDSSESSQ
jgi:hypothetical protein